MLKHELDLAAIINDPSLTECVLSRRKLAKPKARDSFVALLLSHSLLVAQRSVKIAGE